MVAVQGIVAALIPWVVARLVAPGEVSWSLLALIVPLAYALLHGRHTQAWLAPLSGALSVMPWIPAWISGGIAVAVAIVLAVRPPLDDDAQPTRPGKIALGAMGGVLIAVGVGVGLLALVQTRAQDASFEAGQEAAEQAWETATGEAAPSSPATAQPQLVGAPATSSSAAAAPVNPPFAKLRFLRSGDRDSAMGGRVFYVGPDVSERGLAAGPGHYPGTVDPGQPGNVAIAGHRTGWGFPFRDLDTVKAGDRIRLVDRSGAKHTYVVETTLLVDPNETWVLGPDPLGTGKPTLTLTTCDPPGVNSKRLIVLATLTASVPAQA